MTTTSCCAPGSLGHALAQIGFIDSEAGLVRCHDDRWVVQDMHRPLVEALRYRVATRDNVVWVFSGLTAGDQRWKQLRDGIMDRLAALNHKNRPDQK